MKRFLKDEKRGISLDLFAELCGISTRYLRTLFVYELQPVPEHIQIRVSRVLDSYIAGEIRVMQKYNGQRYVEYRKEPKPMAKREYALTLKGGEIKLNIGLQAKGDYTRPDLDELLKGK